MRGVMSELMRGVMSELMREGKGVDERGEAS